MASRPSAGAFWSATTPTGSTSGCGKRRNAPMSPSSTKASRKRWVGGSDRLRAGGSLMQRNEVRASLLILPGGQITSCFPKWLVQPLLQKYFPSHLTQISSLIRTVPSQERGVAHVINVGRDAVDAGSARDEWC